MFSFALGMLHGLLMEEFLIERKKLWKRILIAFCAGSLMYLIFFVGYHQYFLIKLIDLAK